MVKLIAMAGESGSGKSTKAKSMVAAALKQGKKIVRLNRDSMRAMLFNSEWTYKREKLVVGLEVQMACHALGSEYDVIVDDTNLSESNVERWKEVARRCNAEFNLMRMETPFMECVNRDALRTGKEHVGRAVIEKQFLASGRADFGKKQIVLVDVDGTLMNHAGVRNAYDESMVHLDKPYEVVCKWVRNLVVVDENFSCAGCQHHFDSHDCCGASDCACSTGYGTVCRVTDCGCAQFERSPAPEYSVVVVSGRHDTCGDSTITSLNSAGVSFDHIFMRSGGDNRDDVTVKQEILDAILRYVPKERIAFVLDDRPKVLDMWKSNGLTVYPVRGAVEPF